jgi:hypothetical protein
MTDTGDDFRVDKPRANDLVGAELLVAGTGGGFETVIELQVLDANGHVLVETSTTSTNLISPWQARITLPDPVATTRGVVKVGPSTGADQTS